MDQLVHFEIAADNPKRAANFYTKVFGWKFKKWGKMDYWTISTKKTKSGGMDGGLTKREGLFKKKGGVGSYVNTIQVRDLEKTAKLVVKAGGKEANEGGLVHGVGFHQYFYDTEGNLFGALQEDRKAKTV